MPVADESAAGPTLAGKGWRTTASAKMVGGVGAPGVGKVPVSLRGPMELKGLHSVLILEGPAVELSQ